MKQMKRHSKGHAAYNCVKMVIVFFIYQYEKIQTQIEYLHLCYLFEFEDCLEHFYFIILILKF
jgi:hypothetical protein